MNNPYSEQAKPALALYSNDKEDSIIINNTSYVDKGTFQMHHVNSSYLGYMNIILSAVHGEKAGLTKQVSIITNISYNKTGTYAN